jgi:hypothetical protein
MDTMVQSYLPIDDLPPLPTAGFTVARATAEQKAAAALSMQKGDLIVIEARAGTGKTATLELIARSNPRMRFLYTAFNKAIVEEAKRRMPGHVVCQTNHSLAFSTMGSRYKEKLGESRLVEVCRIMGWKPNAGWDILNLVTRFLQSRHPTIRDIKYKDEVPDELYVNAEKLWARMCNTEDFAIKMPHDGYLKLWTLTTPLLRGFDVILADEAQDLNPAMLGVVLAQLKNKTAAVILVGDSGQGIYRWRGAVNAMLWCSKIAKDRLALTESFRFGPLIAARASRILSMLPDTDARLVGKGSGAPGDSSAFLSRTNANLLAAAADTSGPIHFAGTDVYRKFDPMTKYRLQEALDTLHLYNGDRGAVITPRIKKFESYADLKDYAFHEDKKTGTLKMLDPELAALVYLVEKYLNDLPYMVEDIRRRSTGPGAAIPTFSTGHSAKGLEWHTVELAPDFIPVHDPLDLLAWTKGMEPEAIQEEIRLLYVAITRAKHRVVLCPAMEKWFQDQEAVSSELTPLGV